jgi:hypothetical protein
MDQSTEQKKSGAAELLDLLHRLKEEAFGGSDEELALALGRPESELLMWFTRGEEIDEDAEMKIRNLADERLSEN